MEFCDECGSMMKTDDGVWVCDNCGYTKPRDDAKEAAMTTTQGQEESEIIDVSDAENRGLPTTEVHCPECGNDEAYWYMQQIRSADESETRFFVCTECEHRWREDDH
ncbi:transcription factor S [Halococcus thailandensis]|uniref:Transcription factor S n=1 Tax=Halococcus thailandensis JCM 13552 TaxID=1227457 RepID=M0MZV7_9EURY|nr:transcription factor S [Halococcus thailandensis]EMA50369.1 DNA-directed RNA polymerase subunit M1 [Halococcus thailandensis JCM 13552]